MIRTIALLAVLATAGCADKYDETKRVNPLSWLADHTGASFHPSRPYGYGYGYYGAPYYGPR